MKTIILSSAMALALMLVGCGKKDAETRTKTASPPASTTPESAGSGHAPEGVVPGSYEDWCDEHQVPETLCTRCNTALIAAFKATGDWCDEHGLPESQCLACNPDLKIVRPVKTAEPKAEG